MFRSLDMSYHQIICAPDSVWDTMNNLANNEHVMLCQNNHPKFKGSSPMNYYASSVMKRCEEGLENLNKIEARIEDYRMQLLKPKKQPVEYIKAIDQLCEKRQILGSRLFEEIEKQTNEKFTILSSQINIYDQITSRRLFILEKQESFRVMDEIVNFDEKPLGGLDKSDSFIRKDNSDENVNRFSKLEKRFNVVLGMVPTKSSILLLKLLFRVAKDNVIVKSKSLDAVNDKFVKIESRDIPKTLMFILFQKGESNLVYERVKRILNQFEFVELDIPSPSKRTEMTFEIMNELEDNEKIVTKTQIEIRNILNNYCQESEVPNLSILYYIRMIFRREQNFAMNYRYLEQKDGFYQLQIFLPKDQVAILNNDLNSIRTKDPNFARPKMIESKNTNIEHQTIKQPTLFNLNELVQPFQIMVSTYGIPRYKEINPAVFTIISFPFFFGLMFGDFGHGLLVFLIGIYLYLSGNPAFKQLSSMILLMGIFSTFSGFIYNEFFSVPLILGGSCYDVETRARKNNCVYEGGFDWIWQMSANETAFVNSFKMKFSIIIGVTQMLLGTLLKASNALYFSNYLDLFFEAIPQFVLMSVTFGYMSFCIIVKWLTDWTDRNPISIIQVFINFYRVDEALFLTKEVQQSIQLTFILVSFVSIFLMLLVKPIVLATRKQVPKKPGHSLLKDDEADPENLLIQNVY